MALPITLTFACFYFQKDIFKKYKSGLILCLSTLTLFLYLAMGGAIFKIIEEPQEKMSHQAMGNIMGIIKTRYPAITDEAMNDMFSQMSAVGIKGLPDGSEPIPKWTFGNTFLFSITLLTTIGYGHLSPLTPEGKIVTMTYTAVGIPLTMCVMSLYMCRLTSISVSYKKVLFQKLKGPLSTVQINLIHISTIMVGILFGCFIIPATIFDSLEDSWSFLDSLYYCFISLTTVGLGDYVPGLNAQGPYTEIYRISAGIYILAGEVVMMYMLNLASDFYKNCYEEVAIPIAIHTENIPITKPLLPTYGTMVSVSIPEEQQSLLKP